MFQLKRKKSTEKRKGGVSKQLDVLRPINQYGYIRAREGGERRKKKEKEKKKEKKEENDCL